MVHWSRAEEFRQGFLRPMAVIDVRAGLDASGSLTAWDFLDINAGANGFAFPYAVPNRRLRYQPAASPHAAGPVPGPVRDRQHVRARVAYRRARLRRGRRPAALPAPPP